MLRALLRVGQRAVRIQLEHARASGTDLSERVAAPRGGIPGFWVERQRVRDEGTVRSPLSVQDPQRKANATANDGNSGSETAPLPESALEPAKPAAVSEYVPQGRSEDVKPREETVPEARVESRIFTQPKVEEPKTENISKEPVEAESATADVEATLVTPEPVKTKETRRGSVTTEPAPAATTEGVHSEAVETEPIRTDKHNDTTPTEISQPSVGLDEVEQRPPQVVLRPSKVPSSRIGRLFHYGSLVAGMSMGAAGEVLRRSTGQASQGSVFMSEANVRRLVDKLSKMRGAALKLGQFMSIQDTNVLPEQIERVLQQVQANADYMPEWQLKQVLRAELGNDWGSAFADFPRVPMASASIGQVHSATLTDGTPVAVKVQFPGVEASIASDLNNLSLLLRGSAVLPRGLFLNNTVKVFRGELADECNYEKEAENGRRMRDNLRNEPFYEVPRVIDELSTRRVLTTELMSGRPLSEIKGFSQELRDKIGTAALRLCLLELFRYRLMQTDPNWANFLWDDKKHKLQLIDFGATREYSVEFMDKWYRLLKSVIDNDRAAMQEYSLKVGYLTGEENEAMLEAHLRSMELLAIPFTEKTYDFGRQSVTDEVKKLIPTMLKYRLTPPPNETYSLNRKLSGSFLLCAKLGSRVNCRELWEDVVGDYKVTSDI